MVCTCGIPEVTLEGTAHDWRRLREKSWSLLPYDLDWWLPSLRAACDQFVRASEGDIDLAHWKDLYKQERAYGADLVNGWLVHLVPYLKNGRTGNFTERNPLLADPAGQVYTDSLPGGLSQVPFRCRWQGQAEDAAMEFLGGFVGVTQDVSSLALRPKLGWAVRQGSELDRLFAGLAKHHPAPPLDAPEFDRCLGALTGETFCELPGDFLSFYKHCDGVSLPGAGGAAGYRFRPLGAVEMVEGLTGRPVPGDPEIVVRNAGPWVRFCDLADGGFVAVEFRHTYRKGWKVVRVGAGRAGASGSPVVAWSFREFLEQALGDGRVQVTEGNP
jgi:Domain of unknown function (DUF4419)